MNGSATAAKVDGGLTYLVKGSVTAGLLALLAVACSPRVAPTAAKPSPTVSGRDMSGTGTMGDTGGAASKDLAPLVQGFYKGWEIRFIHTEASDPNVASMLTRMMGPQVILVPSLAQVPPAVLAKVFVFNNGVGGGGPFGFQADVFDSVPGDEGYRPLRAVYLVSWKESAPASQLRSEEEIAAAQSRGELTIAFPGIVVNMPILVWPAGHR